MSKFTFEANGKEMAEVLTCLSRSVSKKSTLPILSTVALRIEDGRLYATATNLDQCHRATLPTTSLTGSEGAGACVALDLITTLLARCDGGGAHVVLDGDEITVSAAGRKAMVKTLPLAEFPQLHEATGEGVSVDAERLGRALEAVAFAASNDTTRYALCGVYLSDDGLAVATDGRRLARMRYGNQVCAPLVGVIVPIAAVPTLVEMLGRQSRVEVSMGGGGIAFRAGDEEFFTKLLEGNYPNFRQVIPSFRQPVELRVSRDAMRHALEWVKVVQKDKESSVKLYAEGKEITLSVTTPDVGEVEERIELLATIKGKVHVAMQIRYLLPMVTREGGDEFILSTEFAADGVVMGALVVSEATEDFLGILMPMRIG